ncbi:MAG: CaiB/BaiF CoA transferase family protein [Candidatus Bathyarchaeia archaeon]
MTILEKVRVLDFTHVYFGPYTTMILADMGADVIKVEPPWGEIARMYPPLFGGASRVFHYLDRNKRSLTLNLKEPKGVEIALALAERSDVVVENFSRGAMERLGLGYEDIKEVRPDIVYASLSGFGLDGPYADRPSFASMASALSGWYRITGDIVDPEGPPIRPAEWHGDLDPALYAVIGILGALIHRERTGEGQLVDVSQLDCMLAQNGIPITGYLIAGLHPWEINRKYMGQRFIRFFRASDGWVFIHGTPRMVDRLKVAMGVEELKSREEVDGWVAKRTVQEVLDVLVEAQVPVAPIYGLGEVVEDPQVRHRGMIVEIEHPEAGVVKTVNFPVKFSKAPASISRPAPLLGQHNDEVLTKLLGYGKDELGDLRKRGVIT